MPFAELKQISDDIMFMGSKYDDTCEMQALADYSGEITEIDGKVFRALVANGYAKVAANKDELNKINGEGATTARLILRYHSPEERPP